MKTSSSSVLILVLFALVRCSLQQCYNMDGSIAAHHIACTEFASAPDALVPCCEPGRTCLPNGMCSSSENDPNLERESCTDKTWKSDNCPKFCGQDDKNTTIFDCTKMTGMTKQANMNAYCCAADSPQCCDYQNLMFSAPDLIVAAKPASSSSSSSPSPSTSSAISSLTATTATQSTTESSSASSSLAAADKPTTSPGSSASDTLSTPLSSTLVSAASLPSIVVAATTTPLPKSPNTPKDWTGVEIGAGIGAAIPLLILVIIGVLLWNRHRRHAMHKLLASEDGASSRITRDPSIRMSMPAYLKAHEADSVPQHELDAARGVEMPVRSPRELPGSEGERHRRHLYQSRSSTHPFELG